jgi:hypothetical protein
MLTWMLGSLAFAADPPTVTAAPGKGVTVATADGKYSLTVRSRFQLRESVYAAAPDDDGARDLTFLTSVYTTRVWFTGNVLDEHTKYTLQLALAPRDFKDGAISPVYDAYIDRDKNPNLSFRMGQMFVPFDRLRTIREFSLQMPDRPRAIAEFSLDRDIGVYAYSDHLGGEDSPFGYKVGVFGGSGTNQVDPHPPGGLVVARAELRPFGGFDDDSEGDLDRRDEMKLALGVGAAYNYATTRARSTTSTVYVGGTANYAHLAADLVYKFHGFAFETEFINRMADADVIRGEDEDGNPTVEYTRSGWGFVAQPSFMLSDKVEVEARYGRIAANPGTDQSLIDDVEAHANEVGAGTSVYLNGHRFKIQGGVTALFGEDPSASELTGNVLADMMF